jgi:hypothetical protein
MISWMVLTRDVSGSVSVRGADRLAAVLILDVDTGLVRGLALEASRGKALKKAVGAALTQPAGDLPPGAPARVACKKDLMSAVRAALVGAHAATRPVIEEMSSSEEAEDIFDSLIAHLQGQPSSRRSPSPADWRLLIERAAQFRRAKPWTRWDDGQDLIVELDLDDGAESYVAVVMGSAGVQRGLALYPGLERPLNLRDLSTEPQPPPAGTLLMFLDPAAQVPPEMVNKAVRHGWPANDGLMPLVMTYTADGAAQLGPGDAQRLTAGLAAILALDGRGPALAEVAGRAVTGTVSLADDRAARFAVQHRASAATHDQPALRVHAAGHDLLPPDTAVSVGHIGWDALASLRKTARLFRPAPKGAPPPAGREVPAVILTLPGNDGEALAARIAHLDPYGVAVVDAPGGRSVLVLAGGGAAEVLMELPAGHASFALFARRLRETGGRHALIIADEAAATGNGAVYGLFECHQPVATQPAKKATPRRRGATAKGTTRLRVTLREVEPRVERVIDVPAGVTLDELHLVLQVALGWTDSHLHSFTADGITYAGPHEEYEQDAVDDRGVRLSSLPAHFLYTYDFGDDWEHEVEVLGPGGAEPRCVSGEGACPPEDCGGTSGYAELLEALADPRHDEHEDMTTWVGDRLRPFDLAATDAKVRNIAGRTPATVRMLLDLIGDGVKLTQAGRLPRVLVRTVQEQRPDWFYSDRPASTEDDSPQLSALHELLRRGGLLRLAKGVLRATSAAADEREILRRIRAWFEQGSFELVVAERALAHLAARGPMTDGELAAAVYPWLGHGWRRGDDPITEYDVKQQLWRLSTGLKALEMIAVERGTWTAGPSALTVLPGAVLLADLV